MLRVFNFRYVGGYLIKKFRSIEVFIYKFELNSGSGNILLCLVEQLWIVGNLVKNNEKWLEANEFKQRKTR